MSWKRLATAAGLVAACAAFILPVARPPSPVPATAPATAFSAERAMAQVRAIAQRPHPSGSADLARVRGYLVTRLAGLGLQPRIQEATGVGTRYPVSGRVHNVVVRLPGTGPGHLAVLLMAHYDGVSAGPAAADDGSGTAVLLETLRALRAGPPLRHDVIALFTDGEEPGLLGAAAFVRQHPWARDVGVALNFEARGTGGAAFMFETGPGNLDVVRVLRGAPHVEATSVSTTVYRALPNDTDLSELALLGVPALNFSFIDGVERYHTSEDDPAHLDPGSVQQEGGQALTLSRAFGDGPLPRPRTPDAVFFSVPGLGLVVYPQGWALPLAAVAAALAVLALVRLRGRQGHWLRDPLLGAAGVLLSAGLAAAAGFGAGRGLAHLHAHLVGGGTPAWSGVYGAATAMLAFAIGALGYAAARHWASAAGAHAGALLVWAAATVVVARTSPGLSFLCTWPLLAAAAVALTAGGRSERLCTALTWLVVLVTAAVLVPVLYTVPVVALGVTGPAGVLLAGFVPPVAWLLAPQLEALAGGRRWTTAGLAAVVALVLFGWGAATVRTNARHPVPSSLVYAVDADSGGAWFASPTWGLRSAWARRAVGSGRAPPDWLGHVFDESRIAAAVPVQRLRADAPTARVLADSVAGRARHVTLHITPVPGTLFIGMRADGARVLAASVDGQAVDATRYRRHRSGWSLGYAAPPDSGYTLALILPAGAPVALDLTARLPGIPSLPGHLVPARPPSVVAMQWGDVTVLHVRIQL